MRKLALVRAAGGAAEDERSRAAGREGAATRARADVQALGAVLLQVALPVDGHDEARLPTLHIEAATEAAV